MSPEHTPGLMSLIRRMLWLLVLTSILMAAMAYPFRLPNDWLMPYEMLQGKGVIGWIYQYQLRSQVAFNHSPLVLKESVAQGYLLAALIAFLGLLLYRARENEPIAQSFSQEVGGSGEELQNERESPRNPWWREHLSNYKIWLLLLLIYAGAGAIAWSPTFHYSLRTYLTFSLGVILYAIIVSLPPARAHLHKFMFAMCGCGAVIAVVSVLQHLDLAFFMPDLSAEPRNRMGSFIAHNTGLSSWLLFPLSFSLYALLFSRRLWMRVASAALAVAILFVIVAAQSRAIWLLGAGMLVVYVPLIYRQTGRRITVRFILISLAVLAGLILAQTVAPRKNPLARHMVSLRERVRTDLVNPGQLLRETRLRILFASARLIGQRPLIGHGTGAFQFVYPPAQGEFLKERPDTSLGLTTKRTDLAHNDYLQFLVECGIIGWILLGVPLFMAVQGGLSALSRLQRGPDRALLYSIGFPTATIAVHALVDMPMHIAPIALSAIACLAFWSAGSDIFELDAEAEETILETELSTPASTQSTESGGRVVAVAAITATASVLLISGFAYVFILREFISDIYYSDAQNWISTFRALPDSRPAEQFQSLNAARENYRRSTKISVFNGLATEGMVYTNSALGRLNFNQYRLARSRDPKQAEALLFQARTNYELAIKISENQLRTHEHRWHYTYYLIGQAYKMLWRINLEERRIPARPETPYYLQSAIDMFKAAIDTNIADTSSLYELADLYEKANPPNHSEARRIKHMIFSVDPQFGWDMFLKPILNIADTGHFDDAFGKMNEARRDLGDLPDFQRAEADLLLRRATWPTPEVEKQYSDEARVRFAEPHLKKGRAILDKISPSERTVLQLQTLKMLYALAERNYAVALDQANSIFEEHPRNSEAAYVRMYAGRKLGNTDPNWPGYKATDFHFYTHQRLRLFFFPEEADKAAYHFMEMAQNGERLQLAEGFRTIQYMKSMNHPELAEIIISNMKANYPGLTAVQSLESKRQNK